MDWIGRYGSKYQQFIKAHRAGIKIDALITKPILNEIESFYFMACQQLWNSSFADIESFCRFYEVSGDELEDLIWILSTIKEHESGKKK